MFNLPLYYFLYLFFAALVLWFIISSAGMYHLLKYSAQDKKAPAIAICYVFVSVVFLAFVYSLAGSIDWTGELSLSVPNTSSDLQNIIE